MDNQSNSSSASNNQKATTLNTTNPDDTDKDKSITSADKISRDDYHLILVKVLSQLKTFISSDEIVNTNTYKEIEKIFPELAHIQSSAAKEKVEAENSELLINYVNNID